MLNLLPEQAKKRFILAYRFKFAIMCAVFLCMLLISAVVGLLPSYLNMRVQAERNREQAEQKKQTSGPSIEQAEARVGANKVLAQYLVDRVSVLEKAPTLSLLTKTIFDVAGSAVVIEGIELTGTILTIRGEAATREELISFHQRLKKQQYFETALLPISDLAQSIKPRFSIQIVLPQ